MSLQSSAAYAVSESIGWLISGSTTASLRQPAQAGPAIGLDDIRPFLRAQRGFQTLLGLWTASHASPDDLGEVRITLARFFDV